MKSGALLQRNYQIFQVSGVVPGITLIFRVICSGPDTEECSIDAACSEDRNRWIRFLVRNTHPCRWTSISPNVQCKNVESLSHKYPSNDSMADSISYKCCCSRALCSGSVKITPAFITDKNILIYKDSRLLKFSVGIALLPVY